MRWRLIAQGARPVPERVATPLIWAAAFVSTFALMIVLDLVDALDDTGLALAVLSLLAALLGMRGRFTAAPGTALLCWALLNVHAVHPVGEISWAESRDPLWITCLLCAACAGTAAGHVRYARAAYRRIGPSESAD